MRKSVSLAILVAGLGVLTPMPAHQPKTYSIMVDAAKAFLASLNDEQVGKAKFDFKDEERFNWHFIPRDRKGLPLREMSPHQKHLASALLSAGLSQRGYIKATQIMSLEEVLRIMEKDSGERRNPEKYYFSIFGTPDEKTTWGYRVEGHHLALNFTVVNGKLSGSPNFYGANPAEVREGPRKGLRVLNREEDLARELMQALTPEQKKVAIVDKTAYKDVLTAASRKASLEGQPSGLPVSKMNAKQKAMLTALVEEYIHSMPEQIAQRRSEQFKAAGDKLFFAWAGVEERGGPHYYRVQAPTFLIEYDNTQNNANHIHAVWRDYEGDFGLDLLKQHYDTADHHKTTNK